jgi:hypothetical protein
MLSISPEFLLKQYTQSGFYLDDDDVEVEEGGEGTVVTGWTRSHILSVN